jgi:molybdopterin-guanine dinucleotide biosynthesis protein B
MQGESREPLVIGVAGHADSGKTTLISALVRELRARSLHVGCVKHAPHGIDLDGKDGDRMFAAGAEAVAVCAPGATVVMRATAGEPALDVIVAGMAESALDIVLVEGYKHAPMPRIEVLADGAAPTSDSRWLVALACDDAGASASGVPTFPRGDVIGIAQLICALLSEHRGDGVRALERDALPAAEAQRQA